MKRIVCAAAFAVIALPALARPAPYNYDSMYDPTAAATGLPADPNYSSNIGVTNDTVAEAENDTVNGRAVDLHGEPNTTAGMILSEQRHAMGEIEPAVSR